MAVHMTRAVNLARAGSTDESAKAFAVGEREFNEAMSNTRVSGWFRDLWTGLLECRRGSWLSESGRLRESEAAFRKSILHLVTDIHVASRRSASMGAANVVPAEFTMRVREACASFLAYNLAQP